MNVFVAGGTGVLGRRAVPRLVAAGHEVTGLSRSDAGDATLLDLGARPVRASLFDHSSLGPAVEGHDAMVNLATAIPPLARSGRRGAWVEHERIRSVGSGVVADVALAAGAEVLVQESVAFLYPDHGADPIDEEVELAASSFTAAVQRAEAAAARFATTGGGRGVVLRFGGFAGIDAEHTRLLLRGARRGWSLDPGPPDAYFPTLDLDDAARAVVAALDAPTGTYNVADPPATRAQRDAALARAVGRRRLRRIPSGLVAMAGPAARISLRSQRVSTAALGRATGWSPACRSLDEVWSHRAAALVPR